MPIPENIKEFQFTDTHWHSLKLFGIDKAVTVRSIGGHAVSIVTTTDPDVVVTEAYIAEHGIDPAELGGLAYEISADKDTFIWGQSPTGEGKVSVRIYGTVDPTEDITFVSAALNEITQIVYKHIDTIGTGTVDDDNPHGLGKADVDLGNIPNAISDDPTLNKPDVLATTKATATLDENINIHINKHGDAPVTDANPHGIDKIQVGLGNVENYKMADELTADDPACRDRYMSPWATDFAMKSWIQMHMGLYPQSIMQAPVMHRILGWSSADVDAPVNSVSIVSNLEYRVNAGLQVAFADSGKVRDSLVLLESKTIRLPPNPENGVHYVFANLTNKREFAGFGTTTAKPVEGTYRDGVNGDFFNTATGIMYDTSNNPVRRVYIAKLHVQTAVIKSVTCVPLGKQVTFAYTGAITLGGRVLVDNPFIGARCNVHAEVEYASTWGDSKWNDQIGTSAVPFPADPYDGIIIRFGKMGFLANGEEAGNGFGSGFAAITSPIRTRIVCERIC